MEFQYELFVEENTPYLLNLVSGVKEYKIICINKDSTLIKVEALPFTDKVKMYTKNIKNFNKKTMVDILPECYI